jgi:hypothetical protein
MPSTLVLLLTSCTRCCWTSWRQGGAWSYLWDLDTHTRWGSGGSGGAREGRGERVLGLALRHGACSFHTHGLVCWSGSFTNRRFAHHWHPDQPRPLYAVGLLLDADMC